MEPVRTPSQAVVIFIFLMITLFTYKGNDKEEIYAELYQPSEKLVVEAIPASTTSYQSSNKLTLPDTLHHQRFNTLGQKKIKNRFTIFAYPVSVVQSTR